MVTFYQFVQPALLAMMGLSDHEPLLLQLPCVSDLRKAPGRVEFQRGIMETDSEGRLTVRSTGRQGSGMLSSMGTANCFIILPQEAARVEAGSLVTVQPFAGLV
jgi:molybdopterin molybdotransferase